MPAPRVKPYFIRAENGQTASRVTPEAAVRRALDIAAFKRTQVHIYLREPGQPQRHVAQISAGMWWFHVTDDRIAKAIERIEEGE